MQVYTEIPWWMGKEVWYMAHPIAGDKKYTFEQNMEHVAHMIRLFYSCGFRVVAPYHTLLLALKEGTPEDRELGLEVDCAVVARMKNLVLCGHKMSNGMAREQMALSRVDCCTKLINFVGVSDDDIRHSLRGLRGTQMR